MSAVQQGEREAIGDVIRAHARTSDGRGHWRQERYCTNLIRANGASPRIAELCTQAAIRVGQAIRTAASRL